MSDAAPLWCGVPAFGERPPDADVRDRPGAYALLFDADGRIAVMVTPRGHYLPGGGCDPGESREDALRREVIEECGLACRAMRHLGDADEYVHAPAEASWFRKRGAFFAVEAGAAMAAPAETDHRLRWMAPADAAARLSHGSQRYAVQCWIDAGGRSAAD